MRRAWAVLEAIERRAGYALVPAPVLAETSRTRGSRAAVDRVLQSVRVVSTDRVIAETAGVLLEACGMDSTDAIDAFVVATAAQLPVAVILTADVDDAASLAASLWHVEVQALA